MPKLSKGKAKVLNHDEFKRLLKFVSAGNHAKRNTLLILMSYGTGMRANELAQLRVSDVISEDGKVYEETTLRKTKEKRPGAVYFTDPRIKKAIIDYIEERKSKQNKIFFAYNQPLFMSQKKQGFNAKNMQKLFEEIYKNAGIIGASSHSGRRTFITRLAESGVNIKIIQELARHKSPFMTMEYIKANPITMKRVVSKVLY